METRPVWILIECYKGMFERVSAYSGAILADHAKIKRMDMLNNAGFLQETNIDVKKCFIDRNNI